jgi:hypothetical protein
LLLTQQQTTNSRTADFRQQPRIQSLGRRLGLPLNYLTFTVITFGIFFHHRPPDFTVIVQVTRALACIAWHASSGWLACFWLACLVVAGQWPACSVWHTL